MAEKVPFEQKVLSENDRIAAEIRGALNQRKIFSFNMVSSPGSGKTSLLEKTISAIGSQVNIAVIAGDVQTENDAQRLLRAGCKLVRPIVTGGACHLDANMVSRALKELELENTDLLVIENVGNLVCPSSYDLGEDMKIVVMSTTEGDDKPLKYPAMFRRSSVMVVNKIDLLGTSDFDLEMVKANALKVNGTLTIIETSCRTGAGLDQWYAWLQEQIAHKKQKS
ncbi:MAG: hydrogenase nickel incorporation protein HypB [Candidatus Zixiibacteriota bacterium]|nr:MAG: hydrogenase nickel incorporation protein HypB [candidate division Zixibacteria bacterium]